MIKQLLNSAIAKYRDLSVARRSIICLCFRYGEIIDLLATDKSRYFAQSRPIIAYNLVLFSFYFCMSVSSLDSIFLYVYFFISIFQSNYLETCSFISTLVS